MRRKTYELYYALAALIAITVVYALVAAQALPRSSSLFGHGIGILGFLMMLSTEILYSLRKRARGRAIGRMSTWLQIHIFTGIVGPYLVLLHASWKFNGLAGALILLTAIIVVSGFIGRYIYTAVPRTVDGAEVAVRDLESQIAVADAKLQALGASRLASTTSVETPGSAALVLERGWLQRKYDREVRRAIKQLDATGQAHAAELRRLLDERYRVQRQIQSLATARRLLAVWHTIHIPIGVALFTVAFIHVGVTLYYATFIK